MRAGDELARGQEFVVVHRFMLRDLDLSGVTLLVYARIYGFCRDGGEFYESRASTADFLRTTPRTVTRAVDELLDAGLIREAGTRETGAGRRTKSYVLTDPAHPNTPPHDGVSPDEPSPDEKSPDEKSPDEKSPQGAASPDDLSGGTVLNPDGSSGLPVTGYHPIRKVDNKWF